MSSVVATVSASLAWHMDIIQSLLDLWLSFLVFSRRPDSIMLSEKYSFEQNQIKKFQFQLVQCDSKIDS
jgi:hypothetical protein